MSKLSQLVEIRNRLVHSAVLLTVAAALVAPQQIRGRNNTILFVTSDLYGLANVHLATAYDLLKSHPDAEVHYASFSKFASRVKRTSSQAQKAAPEASDVTFHALNGRAYGEASALTQVTGSEMMVHPPGLASAEGFCRILKLGLSPWPADEYYDIYLSVQKIIEEVNPAIVVLDMLLNPALDATRDMHHAHAILTPNVLTGIAPAVQPSYKVLWKWPAVASGYPFPLPWSLVPANIYLNFQTIRCALSSIDAGGKRANLKGKGIEKPLDFMGMYRPDVPWITQTLPGAHFPLDNIPSNVICTGPINLADVGGERDEGSEIIDWIQRAPTMMISLGSHYKYTDQQAAVMLEAIQLVLRQTDIQVLWKVVLPDAVDDSFLQNIDESISDRFRSEKWLDVEPPSLLRLDTMVASVHHGGAGCFHDALSAGVPQVILPMWVDLYDFAQLVEYLGIGTWACQDISPHWSAECLAGAFLKVLEKSDTSTAMKQRARGFGKQAQLRSGRAVAAEEVAKLAAMGS
ncbi:hypothetical protein EDB81DRAFT_836846 [Dactylonectria macrodidyma]|uniref:Erythromycin biosynthesis protein CIII-like C-terminal domain-containing protein n=1 Tax=Dactylonectria macrodidyma TaxID=307937 RepID=A0A9P9FTF6_9HYPO|nr:hypothetical protein EDB81DRAFT_836846 [Dactylonectria macrodidyma]